MTCSYACRNEFCTEKITMCKKDDRSLHQVFHSFIARKGLGLSLCIRPSRKSLKVDIFQEILRLYNLREKYPRKILLLRSYHNDQIIIYTKIPFLYRWKAFWIICIENIFAIFFQHVAAYLFKFFCFASYSNSWKWCITMP